MNKITIEIDEKLHWECVGCRKAEPKEFHSFRLDERHNPADPDNPIKRWVVSGWKNPAGWTTTPTSISGHEQMLCPDCSARVRGFVLSLEFSCSPRIG